MTQFEMFLVGGVAVLLTVLASLIVRKLWDRRRRQWLADQAVIAVIGNVPLRDVAKVLASPEAEAISRRHLHSNGDYHVIHVFGSYYVCASDGQPLLGPIAYLSRAALWCDLAAADDAAAAQAKENRDALNWPCRN